MNANGPLKISDEEAQKVQEPKGRNHDLWKSTEAAIAAELYTDFVPRFFKKQEGEIPNHEIKATVGWLVPGLKLCAATGLALSMAFKIIGYKPILCWIGGYLLFDSAYQIFDIGHSLYCKDLRKAATVAIDLLTYPLYLILHKLPHNLTEDMNNK